LLNLENNSGTRYPSFAGARKSSKHVLHKGRSVFHALAVVEASTIENRFKA